MITQLYNNRQATINEYREAAGLAPVKGGDKWGDDVPLDKMSVSQKTDTTKPLAEKYKKDKSFVEALQESKLKNPVLKSPLIKFNEKLIKELATAPGDYAENLDAKFKEALSGFLANKR
jgi:hypothetical protein